jgi:hypothetical protein
MSETPALQRPRQVTVAAWMVILGSVFVVISAFDQVTSLNTLETRDALNEALAEPALKGLDLDIEDAVLVLRTVAMVTAACAAATAILGYFVLKRHHGARIVLTALAVPLFVGGLLPGGSLGLLVAVSVVLLWLDPSRAWFKGEAPRPREAEPSADRPDPFAPPASPPEAPGDAQQPTQQPTQQPAQQPASEPRAHQGFGSVPTAAAPRPPTSTQTAYPPPAYPPPPPGAQPYGAPPPSPAPYSPYAPVRPAPAAWTRPPSVLAACIVTWICSSLAVLLMGATLAVVLASPESLIDEMYRQDPNLASRDLGTDSLQTLTTVTSALVIAWSVAAIVLAVFVLRRSGWARYGLLGSAGGAGGLCAVASLQAPFLVVPLLACVVTFSLLLRSDVRDWFSRSPSNP